MMTFNPPSLKAAARRWRGKRVGLYGGSFNPAHDGHLHVALEALKRLPLDAVWLMVSPGNPFKDMAQDMAPFGARLESAQELADCHPRLFACDLEEQMASRYSAETTARLRSAMPHTDFLWMMGADNLQHFHRWHKIDRLIHSLPIAIFDRPLYARTGLASRFVSRFWRHRVAPRRIFGNPCPAWTFVTVPRHSASATEIRRQIGLGWAESEGRSWQKTDA